MLVLILIKNLSYKSFIENKEKLNFSFLFQKIRSGLPNLARFNKKIILNDGLPTELIAAGFESSKIIQNKDILILNKTSDLNISDIYQQINEIVNCFTNKCKNTNFVIVSTEGEKDPGTITGGGVQDKDINLPVIFAGPYFESKKIEDKFYTINDVAITINSFYNEFIENKRGKKINFIKN
ncbi:hypothetical protein [Mycoplasma sp. SG1]|uniref:hypothetical protein n=1 Tax=Mycoplasma sp. SG1 TaxID=2810348 RepID=UPI0020245F6A|nr:hypothetical protein [Mycoplasma sp. SG1]URM52787.1 hypothetical protein JRW51_00370 [Mycoplasma sp. SG1]